MSEIDMGSVEDSFKKVDYHYELTSKIMIGLDRHIEFFRSVGRVDEESELERFRGNVGALNFALLDYKSALGWVREEGHISERERELYMMASNRVIDLVESCGVKLSIENASCLFSYPHVIACGLAHASKLAFGGLEIEGFEGFDGRGRGI